MFLSGPTRSCCRRTVVNAVSAVSPVNGALLQKTTTRSLCSNVSSNHCHLVVSSYYCNGNVVVPTATTTTRSFSSNGKSTTATEQEKEEETTETSQQEEQKQEQVEEDPTVALKEEIQKLTDQLYRAVAEQENIRKIARNDVNAAQQYSIKKFAKSLLDVADNLDRALDSVQQKGKEQEEQTDNEDPAFRSFYQGIELTRSGLTKALESNGVTPFCQEPGEVFNPEHHEALMEYPDPNSTPGTVGQVVKKGYMLNGRVLRPAEVAVVKK
jgi:molecular chaperone GrpE